MFNYIILSAFYCILTTLSTRQLYYLLVEGEVCEVHGTGGLDGEPHAPQHFTSVHDPQELVLRGGLVEQGDLLVDKERVRHPDKSDVLGTNNCHTNLTFHQTY